MLSYTETLSDAELYQVPFLPGHSQARKRSFDLQDTISKYFQRILTAHLILEFLGTQIICLMSYVRRRVMERTTVCE